MKNTINRDERVEEFAERLRFFVMEKCRVDYRGWESALRVSWNWYPDTTKVALDIAREFHLTLVQASGIVAAFSIRTRWSKNIEDVYTFLRTFQCDGLKIRVKKALLILRAGASATWDDVRAILHGKKIIRFAHNILFGNDSDHATIDVWMCRIFGIIHNKLSKAAGLYEDAERATQIVAQQLSMPVPAFQAFVWVLVRGRAD